MKRNNEQSRISKRSRKRGKKGITHTNTKLFACINKSAVRFSIFILLLSFRFRGQILLIFFVSFATLLIIYFTKVNVFISMRVWVLWVHRNDLLRFENFLSGKIRATQEPLWKHWKASQKQKSKQNKNYFNNFMVTLFCFFLSIIQSGKESKLSTVSFCNHTRTCCANLTKINFSLSLMLHMNWRSVKRKIKQKIVHLRKTIEIDLNVMMACNFSINQKKVQFKQKTS